MPIRLLTKKDKNKILDLDKSIFGDCDGGWTSRDFDHYFSKGTCYGFYKEEKNDDIIGYIFTRQSQVETYISNIGVKKELEGHGIGKELMKQVMLQEHERSKNGSFLVKLQVNKDNERAIGFYQRLGFEEYSRSGSWIQMKAEALPKIFQYTAPTPTKEEQQRQQQELESRRKQEEQQRQQQELELRRKQEDAQRKREKINKSSLMQIDKVLDEFKLRIEGIKQHHVSEAFDTASNLLIELKRARNTYEKALNNNFDRDGQEESAKKAFNKACEIAIKKAKPILKRDLSWGDYIINILKFLINAVRWIVTAGNANSFFSYVEPKSLKAVEVIERDLMQKQETLLFLKV